MALGGALWAQYNLAFGPQQFFFAQTFTLLAMLVVGGLASTSGAIVGAFAITAVFELMRRAEDRSTCPDHADRRRDDHPDRSLLPPRRADGAVRVSTT